MEAARPNGGKPPWVSLNVRQRMSLRSYITKAVADFPKVVTSEMVSPACSSFGFSPTEFCDLFAKEVARDYLDGKLSWSDADVAMNALSGFFFVYLPPDAPFPDYAFGIFLAFDAGETLEEPENERITKKQLETLNENA
jgi:hypothetical protein